MFVWRQIWRGPTGFDRPTNLLFFLNFRSQAVIGHFPTATWQPTIGPHPPLLHSPATSAYNLPPQLPHQPSTLVCHVTVRSATWMYGLPLGTFLLLHEMTQNNQI